VRERTRDVDDHLDIAPGDEDCVPELIDGVPYGCGSCEACAAQADTEEREAEEYGLVEPYDF
jgi:hypothetical protein